MPLYQNIKCTAVANSYGNDPLVETWSDRVVVTGYDLAQLGVNTSGTSIGANFLREAFIQTNEIPASSDMHPVYADCCCSGVQLRPAPGSNGSDSPDSIHADVSWLMPRKDSQGITARAMHLDSYQLQEIRNFDRAGKRTSVLYKVDHPNPLFPPYRIADIRVPRTMHSLQIAQFENVSGNYIGSYTSANNDPVDPLTNLPVKLPFFNADGWMGFGKNELLFIGRCVDYEGLPIARVRYHFLTNDRGWNKFIAVYTQQNGYVPQDLDDLPSQATDPTYTPDPGQQLQNGIGIFNMLQSASFSDIFPQIKPVSM